METIATNSNNDIFLNEYNNLSLSSDIQAVANICKNAILTRYNELIYNQKVGIPYFQTIFTDTPDVSNFQIAVIQTLSDVEEVEEVEDFKYTINNKILTYTVLLLTKYGKIQLNG